MHSTNVPKPTEYDQKIPLYLPNRFSLNDPPAPTKDTILSGAADDKKASRGRALVVDDAPDVTEMLAMLLRHVGYDVVMAFSATEALDIARADKFDVVVSDIGMPGMNGYELAEALRQLPNYSGATMIAVTGFAMYDVRDRALESGFNAFLTKPVNPLTLMEMLQRLHN